MVGGLERKNGKGHYTLVHAREKEEKGLGLYSNEYWAIIEDVTRSLTKKPESSNELANAQLELDEKKDPTIKVIEEVSRNLGKFNVIRCLHIGADGFCDYWRLEELPKDEQKLERKESEFLFKKLNRDDGKTVEWALRPLPIYCKSCPAFVDERMIDFINSRMRSTRRKKV